jgi:hypothetical protein
MPEINNALIWHEQGHVGLNARVSLIIYFVSPYSYINTLNNLFIIFQIYSILTIVVLLLKRRDMIESPKETRIETSK